MQPVSRIYLDTNIFIMAFEWRDEKSELLSRLFASSDDPSSQKFVTSELTFSELLVAPYRRNDESLAETYEGLATTNPWLEVAPVQMPALRYAAVFRSQYGALKLPDAIHLSTAIGTNCSHILTDDRRIQGEYHLIHMRHGVANRAGPLNVLRPDEQTLTSLLQSATE